MTGVVATGCAHCIGAVVAVAGLAAALVAAEGLEGASGEVGSGESRVAERGFLPRLAEDEGAERCLPLIDGELEGFAGMKVRSWKGEGEAMMAEWQVTDLPCLDKFPRLESVDRPWLAVYLPFHLHPVLALLPSQTTHHLRTALRLPS